MRKIIILMSFIILSGCASVPPPIPHPDVEILTIPKLPATTRAVLDCTDHLNIDICTWIQRRESILKEQLHNQFDINRSHNEKLH